MGGGGAREREREREGGGGGTERDRDRERDTVMQCVPRHGKKPLPIASEQGNVKDTQRVKKFEAKTSIYL